jgi:hypothetical protein
MHLITRRLSPSLVLAVAALWVALAGTAAAAVIITSPDQLAGNVVTGPKIVDGSVAQADERNPSLRARIGKTGAVLTGDVPGGSVDHVKGTNRYDVTFSSGDLGPLGLDTCGAAAAPWFDIGGDKSHKPLVAYVNHALGAKQLNVFMFEPQMVDLDDDGPLEPEYVEEPVEAAFDLVLAC